jgi:hypothetical protein
MGGRGAIWCNGPVIPGTQNVSRRFVVMGFNFERGVGEMLEDLGHRTESIMDYVFRDVPDHVPEAPDAAQISEAVSKSFWQRLLSSIGLGQPQKKTSQSPIQDSKSKIDLNGNLWKQFVRYDKTHPGLSSCGTVHFAPSSVRDYDWGNQTPVLSNADDWLNYPNFTGERRVMTCDQWGHGEIRQHHLWWLKRLPHIEGETPTGKLNNWWEYVVGLRF